MDYGQDLAEVRRRSNTSWSFDADIGGKMPQRCTLSLVKKSN